MKKEKSRHRLILILGADVFLATDLISNFIHLNLGLLFFFIPLQLMKRIRNLRLLDVGVWHVHRVPDVGLS